MNLNPALKIFQPKINFQDKLFFTKHLATMIKAGVPIEEALETLSEQGKNKIIKETLAMVSKQVQNKDSPCFGGAIGYWVRFSFRFNSLVL